MYVLNISYQVVKRVTTNKIWTKRETISNRRQKLCRSVFNDGDDDDYIGEDDDGNHCFDVSFRQ